MTPMLAPGRNLAGDSADVIVRMENLGWDSTRIMGGSTGMAGPAQT